jgi:hypothetical protein
MKERLENKIFNLFRKLILNKKCTFVILILYFMKNFKLLLLTFCFGSLIACSTSSSDPTTPPSGGTTLTGNDYFNYKIDGASLNVSTWTAYRTENNFEVLGNASDGTGIYLSFNKFGRIIRIGKTSSASQPFTAKNSFPYFSSNYFNFQLITLDEVNKKFKLTYSGKIYKDQYDISSIFSNIEGDLQVSYTERTPTITGLTTFAKINGNDWNYTTGSQTSNGSFNSIILNQQSGDQYQLSFAFDKTNFPIGSYNYTSTTQNNIVVLSKYNTSTNSFDYYNCAGNLTLSQKINASPYIVISGTFSFVATNPVDGSIINVTNGTFKTTYN